MRVPALAALLILSILHLRAAADPSAGLRFPAQVVARHDSCLLVTTNIRLPLSPGFRFEAAAGANQFSAPVAGSLGSLALIGPIPESDLDWLTTTADLEMFLSLDPDDVTPQLTIAVPSFFSDLDSSRLPQRSLLGADLIYHRFVDSRDLEIESRLGRIDAVLLPLTELAPPDTQPACYVGAHCEIFLFVKDNVDDLAAAALNYALKGYFSDNSALFAATEFDSLYPASEDHARELFAGIKSSRLPKTLAFVHSAALSRTADTIRHRIADLSGRPLDISAKSGAPIALYLFCSTADNSLDSLAVRQILTAAADFGINWRALLPDSCLVAGSCAPDCLPLLRRKLAESCRIIPLGTVELAPRFLTAVHCLQLPGAPAGLENLYRLRQQ